MNITDLIIIMVFILPGIITERISFGLDCPSGEKRSEFRDTVNCILLSFPVIAFATIILSKIYGYKTLEQFTVALHDLSFLLWFIVLVLVFSSILGLIKGLSKDERRNSVNWIRGKFNKMIIDDKSCWRKFLLEKNVSKYMIVEMNNKTYEGFALHYSLPNEEMSIVLENPDALKDYPEFKKYLGSEEIFLNMEKGIIIKSYDTQEVTRYFNIQS